MMRRMDAKGAQELTRVLTERHGAIPEAVPPAPLSNAAAAPIFHWLGIEPPSPAPAGGTVSE